MGTAVSVWPMPIRAVLVAQQASPARRRAGSDRTTWEARLARLERRARGIMAARLTVTALGMTAATLAGAAIGMLR